MFPKVSTIRSASMDFIQMCSRPVSVSKLVGVTVVIRFLIFSGCSAEYMTQNEPPMQIPIRLIRGRLCFRRMKSTAWSM